MPDTCECTEKWVLRGLGKGIAFIIDLETEVTGTPLSDCFTLHTRYKAVAQDVTSTQLDLEAELHWSQHTLLKSRVEQAVLDEVRRGFEAIFLPLVAQWLEVETWPKEAAAAAIAAAPERLPVPTEVDSREETVENSSSRPVAMSPRNSDGGQEGIQSEYEKDWTGWSVDDTSNFELRVEVVSASNLHPPEYRFGDLSWSFFKGSQALLSNVYVQLQLGPRKVRTECAVNENSDVSVGFTKERALFVYSGEVELHLHVYDQRSLQAMVRGDPLVGEGKLHLSSDLVDCLPRWADVPLARDCVGMGTVALRYQLLKISVGVSPLQEGCRPPNFQTPIVTPRLSDSHHDAEFVTPPDSPRGADGI